jgi:hypothetical protein
LCGCANTSKLGSMNKITDAMTMMAEVSKTQLTKSRRGPPAYRKPTQTRAGRLRQEMIAAYVAALGGADRISPIQMAEVMRAVDMTLLAEGMRAKALRGEAIDIGDMVRLEGAVSRVIRSLNLPAPNAAAPGDDAWRKFLAGQHATTGEDG